jgi:hypothetical protein
MIAQVPLPYSVGPPAPVLKHFNLVCIVTPCCFNIRVRMTLILLSLPS